MVVILEIKMSLVIIKKSIYHCDPPYTRRVSSHRVLYLKFLSSYNICIIYLHVIEACLNVAVFYFFSFEKSFKCYKKYFYFHLFLKQKKQRNINLLSDVMKNGHIFPSKVQYHHRFLFSREMESIRASYVCKNVLNFNCQDSICFAFFKLFKNKESFGKSFSFSFFAK